MNPNYKSPLPSMSEDWPSTKQHVKCLWKWLPDFS